MTNETIEQRAERIVRQEVQCCMSSLVATLANAEGCIGRTSERLARNQDEAAALCEQAAELAAPVADYEEAARQAGWTHIAPGEGLRLDASLDYPLGRMARNWRHACELSEIDPYEWEVYEHWAVSGWLADRLIEQGEKVDKDFSGMCVWARTTTGQGIAMDSCLERIARKVEEENAAMLVEHDRMRSKYAPSGDPFAG